MNDLFEQVEETFRKMLESGIVPGVYLAKITGEVLEEDETFIEVLIGENSYYAKPCMPFGHYVVPNKQWLAKYKNEVLAWVAFENGNPAHPVYLGVCPIDEKTPGKDYQRMPQFKSEFFDYSFNDRDKQFLLRQVDESGKVVQEIEMIKNQIHIHRGRQGVIIQDSKTIIGNGTGVASAVLAEKLDVFLQKLLKLIATGATPAGPLSTAAAIGAMSAELKSIYSNSIKLD